ncbi:MAG: hypothetical protein JXA54_09660 [Candidatus Heimdallarchaeota archaeon]|nr:hypothetical protein [Candidatus Heimdallarchaeota archaeon]
MKFHSSLLFLVFQIIIIFGYIKQMLILLVPTATDIGVDGYVEFLYGS